MTVGHKSEIDLYVHLITCHFKMLILVVIWLSVIYVVSATAPSSLWTPPTTFKAAVYSHKPIVPNNWNDMPKTRFQAVAVMNKNLAVYEEQVKIASEKNVQIIVFPEDGLYGLLQTRSSLLLFLETIPDPKHTRWNPCDDPHRFQNTDIQQSLSCLAKRYKMYVVANMGNYIPCNILYDLYCPKDGRYQYNTDVAYDSDGNFVARYHKVHLYHEYQFDTPRSEVIYFDAPFGRFGLLTCFDLIKYDPTIIMMNGYNVTNIAFLTAWYDGLPLLTAIGFHSSFSRGLGINFLDANIQLPASKFHGSGIFTPEGVAAFYYNTSLASTGKLIISTLDILKPRPTISDISAITTASSTNLNNDMEGFNTDSEKEFDSISFHDTYRFRRLAHSSDKIKICQNDVCCFLDYEFSKDGTNKSKEEMFAFGVYDGLNIHLGGVYMQVCVLLKCADDNDWKSCGASSKVSNTKFKSFSIKGKFQTKYVYPQVILVDPQSGELHLGNKSSWSYIDGVIKTIDNQLGSPLISAGLLARDYRRG